VNVDKMRLGSMLCVSFFLWLDDRKDIHFSPYKTCITWFFWKKWKINTGLTVDSANDQGSHYLLILKFKDFQGPSNFIFKDQFSTKVYSMSSRTAIFNVYATMVQ